MKKKILIIGAGAAGLMAAYCLVKEGYDITIVEARDRIGGRIHTEENGFSIPIEKGAEFMHGKQPQTLSLIKESKNQKLLLKGKRYQISEGALTEGDFFDDQWDLLSKTLKKLKVDTDMATFLKEHFPGNDYSILRERVKNFVEGYDAADLDQVSALALKHEWEESDDEHQYHIAGGYIKLMQYLQDAIEKHGGELILSSPVTQVQWSEKKVRLTTSAGRVLEGENAVITIPLGVLQRDNALFSPHLPDYAHAFRQMGFGGVIKVFFEFDRSFWEDQIQRPLKKMAFIFSDAAIPTWWSQLPLDAPMLTGWFGGPSTFNTPDDPEILYDKAISSMAYIFRCTTAEIKSMVRNQAYANWVTDPFTFGAYSYPTTKTAVAMKCVSMPVRNTLYFAGEAVYEGTAMGTVEAALVSGREVCKKIQRSQ